jgi:prepilin-type processing-associated H-X9-DG protein
MKQFTLGLMNYHDTQNSLPAAASRIRIQDNNDECRYSPHVKILPYVEQSAYYDAINAAANAGTIRPWISNNGETEKAIPSYLCPSDGNAKNEGLNRVARTNLMYSLGDGVIQMHTTTPTKTGGRVDASERVTHRIPFAPNEWKSLASITDGTSNTIAVSEAVTMVSTSDTSIRSGGAKLSGLNTGMTLKPSLCLSIRDPLDNKKIAASYQSTAWQHTMKWTDGMPAFTGFNTVMPPNGPTCSPTGTCNAWALLTATSNHSGGVNVGYIDGSVHFVSDTVDTKGLPDHTQGPAMTGTSPLGVWGALGSINGGESVSM